MNYSFSNSFGNLSSHLVLQIRREFMQLLAEAGIDMSPNEWFVISKLFETNTCNQNELADELGLNKVRISRLVLELEQKKIIQRNQKPLDKRHKSVSLTEEGKNTYLKIKPIAQRVNEIMFDQFNEKEKELFYEFYYRISKNLS